MGIEEERCVTNSKMCGSTCYNFEELDQFVTGLDEAGVISAIKPIFLILQLIRFVLQRRFLPDIP